MRFIAAGVLALCAAVLIPPAVNAVSTSGAGAQRAASGPPETKIEPPVTLVPDGIRFEKTLTDNGNHFYLFYRYQPSGSTDSVAAAAKYLAPSNVVTSTVLFPAGNDVLRMDANQIPNSNNFNVVAAVRPSGVANGIPQYGIYHGANRVFGPVTNLPAPTTFTGVRNVAIDSGHDFVEEWGQGGIEAFIVAGNGTASGPITITTDPVTYTPTLEGGNGEPIYTLWTTTIAGKNVVRLGDYNPSTGTESPAQNVSDPTKGAIILPDMSVNPQGQPSIVWTYNDYTVWGSFPGGGPVQLSTTGLYGFLPQVTNNPFDGSTFGVFEQGTILTNTTQAVRVPRGSGPGPVFQISASNEEGSDGHPIYGSSGDLFVSYTQVISSTEANVRLAFQPKNGTFQSPFSVPSLPGFAAFPEGTPNRVGDILFNFEVFNSGSYDADQLFLFDESPPNLSIGAKKNVSLFLTCPDTEKSCSGTATATLSGRSVTAAQSATAASVVGSASFKVRGGKSVKVKLKLTRAGKRLFAHHRSARVRVVASVKDAVGNTAVIKRSLTLKR
ncbi:MAG: hypothetical protein WBB76_02330 [Gaiellaceae bacterium]